MSEYDPIELLFGGMAKLGPGSDLVTKKVLESLPLKQFETVVDVGCGTGRQSFVLARELGVLIHAIDNYGPFLTDLNQRVAEADENLLVETHCLDMCDLGSKFGRIDLLWAEGSAYSIGFENALRTWRPLIAPEGFLVVNELCWLTDERPSQIEKYFQEGYPDMRAVAEVKALCENLEYDLHSTHTLPRQSWIDGYYDQLGPRAKALSDHPDHEVREFAQSMLKEIDLFEQDGNSYAYVFFVLSKREQNKPATEG